MGENYVLGNRDDENCFTPYKLDPRMFEENRVVMMALGTQHTVALAMAGPDAEMPVLESSLQTEQKVESPVKAEAPVEPKEEEQVPEAQPEPIEEKQPDQIPSEAIAASQESKKRTLEEMQ